MNKRSYETLREIAFELYKKAAMLMAAFSLEEQEDARLEEMLKKIPPGTYCTFRG